MDKALIIGSGLSVNFELIKSWDGIIVSSDKMYYTLSKKGLTHIDYVCTLEDNHMLAMLFSNPPSGVTKPKVITSVRTHRDTLETLMDNEFTVNVWRHPVLTVTWNSGLMCWFYAWHELGIKDITLTGFDHLYPESESGLMHTWWREEWEDFHKGFVPDDVVTHMSDEKNYKIQRRKDVLRIDEPNNIFPGFGDMNNYIRYRERRDGLYIRKMKQWQDDRVA